MAIERNTGFVAFVLASSAAAWADGRFISAKATSEAPSAANAIAQSRPMPLPIMCQYADQEIQHKLAFIPAPVTNATPSRFIVILWHNLFAYQPKKEYGIDDIGSLDISDFLRTSAEYQDCPFRVGNSCRTSCISPI